MGLIERLSDDSVSRTHCVPDWEYWNMLREKAWMGRVAMGSLLGIWRKVRAEAELDNSDQPSVRLEVGLKDDRRRERSIRP